MGWTRASARWATTVLLPLLLAAVVLPGSRLAVACRFTGVAMPADACCPVIDQPRPDPEAHLRDQACCVVTTSDTPVLVADRGSDAQLERLFLDFVALSTPTGSLAIWPTGRVRARVASPCRPPPLALKQTLLI